MHEKIPDNLSANQRKTVVSIPFHDFFLSAYLYLPENPVALVLFSHGSGSSRFIKHATSNILNAYFANRNQHQSVE